MCNWRTQRQDPSTGYSECPLCGGELYVATRPPKEAARVQMWVWVSRATKARLGGKEAARVLDDYVRNTTEPDTVATMVKLSTVQIEVLRYVLTHGVLPDSAGKATVRALQGRGLLDDSGVATPLGKRWVKHHVARTGDGPERLKARFRF